MNKSQSILNALKEASIGHSGASDVSVDSDFKFFLGISAYPNSRDKEGPGYFSLGLGTKGTAVNYSIDNVFKDRQESIDFCKEVAKDLLPAVQAFDKAIEAALSKHKIKFK